MVNINIKPLSVNQCWQGKRFKTPKYKQYEKDLLLMLPKIKLPKPPFKVYYEFGFSNSLSDWDNPIKPLQDILQKKYDFDDRHIFEATVKKTKVKKGKEYIKFEINSINTK
jgi:Holliday junction resolvase RusA-like endonuclease